MTFKEFMLLETADNNDRLRIYRCPYCGGNAYNGEPGSGFTYRGSAKCSACNESFSAIKMKPISENGPLIGQPPKEFTDMCARTDKWLKENSPDRRQRSLGK